MRLPQLQVGFATNLETITWPRGLITAPLEIAWPPDGTLLNVWLDPGTATLRATATEAVWHYYRWADATLRPQPPAPPPFVLERGDCYVALAPAPTQITDITAIARYVHLRDYFNAAKLAEGIWAELLTLAEGQPMPEMVVLVVEAR